MDFTPEQQAIRQHLSKERPFNGGCGCIGKQPVQPLDRSAYHSKSAVEYEVVVTSLGTNRLMAVAALRDHFKISLVEVAAVLKDGCWQSPVGYVDPRVIKKIRDIGCSVVVLEHAPALQPRCPCAMQWVEQVDSHYYAIEEHRTVEGITHSAVDIGPVGGPYIQE